MRYTDVTARAIAMEKRRIERAAKHGPVWDSKMEKHLKNHPRNTDTLPPSNQDKVLQNQDVEK